MSAAPPATARPCWRVSPATWSRWKKTQASPNPRKPRSPMRRMSPRSSGPLAAGWPQGAPYDAILLEGAAEQVPAALFDSSKTAAGSPALLGGGPSAKATLYRRSGADVGGRAIFDAAAAVLPGFVKPPAFAF